MMPYGWNDGGWGIFWMVVSMVVFWGGLVAIVILLVRSTRYGQSNREDTRRDPTELLRERFARGEISEQEYRDRLRVLEETRRG